jgi:5-methylcytosine-specific restriction endonuclease McrA
MTWDNYGSYWVIDHVVPLSEFDLTKRAQILKACNYTNLQPLTKPDHYRKTARENSEKRLLRNNN